jgi:hypothetical protein
MPTPRKTQKAPAKKTSPRTRRAAEQAPARPAGIAAKRAQTRGEDGPVIDPYAPTSWGSEDSSGSLVDLDLPSGQRCLAQRPGPEGLMTAGLLDDLDMLSTVLPKVMGGRSSAKKFDAGELLRNPEMVKQAVALMNRVVVHVVVKPEITPEPADPQDKERGKIYPSSVSMDDKSFIFNWAVGGTRDLQRFRDELEGSVADVESGEGMEDQA